MLSIARSLAAVGRQAVAPVVGNGGRDGVAVQRLVDRVAKSGRLEPVDRFLLASASARWALSNPYQGTGVALLGEVTGEPALIRMRDRMLESAEGRSILKNRTPAFDSSLNAEFKPGTLGKLLQHCVPEERARVSLIKDPELGFVMRRYRDAHDIIHALTGFPVTVAGEVALKWYESAATQLPMTTLAAVFGMTRAEPNSAKLLAEWVPWAASAGRKGTFYLSVPFSDYLHYDVDEFRHKVMKWPTLPPLLFDKEAILAHYGEAITQANREGRDAVALKIEADRVGSGH